MNFEQIKQLDELYGAETFARFPIAFESGEGATLKDTEGKEYIDFGSGIAVNAFGVNDTEWKNAVWEQLN
ncbi:MAG: aspartate aminotransferase family protein, partial [Clostridia bacterium]|nr:aspartate aminotransferase family protein [Clostridia bacterium]